MKQIFLFLISAFISFSCIEQQLIVESSKSPEMALSVSDLKFSKNQLTNTIKITNEGIGDFYWLIESLPAWLSANKKAGYVKNGDDNIILTVNDLSLVPVENKSQFVIKSTGGSKNITAEINLPSFVDIIAGERVRGYKIGMTYAELISTFGANFIFTLEVTGTTSNYFYIHRLTELNTGIMILFKLKSWNLSNTSQVTSIQVVHPNTSLTDKYIGLDFPKSKVESIMGAPEYYDAKLNRYDYTSRKISFYLKEQTNLVEKIEIF